MQVNEQEPKSEPQQECKHYWVADRKTESGAVVSKCTRCETTITSRPPPRYPPTRDGYQGR